MTQADPRVDYYIDLAQRAASFADNDPYSQLMRSGECTMTLTTERVDRTRYHVLTVREGAEVVGFSRTSSEQELGMDIEEFLGDFFPHGDDRD